METLLHGLCIYLDDILIVGTSDEEHLYNLRALQQLETAEMKLKKEKSAFLLPRVEYLGHGISSNSNALLQQGGCHRQCTCSSNLTELLDLVDYYRKFLADVTCPSSSPLAKGNAMEVGT